MATKKTKGKWIVKLLKAAVTAYLLLILCQMIGNAYSRLSITHKIPVSEEWNLIVVNRWNELPEDYSVELTELSNGQKVDSRIYPYLQEMFDAARAEDVYPVVREGYRTAEEQQEILDDKIQSYINQGYSQVKAERTAKEWVALPGTSEHQLGIAVDINADKSKCSNEDVYGWLAENAYKYGFVLRYPPGKQKITGTSYEPWHYRYVGEEAAKEIYERGICLEEYFKQMIEEVGL
jgi:D-alanyl-D-alanine carboxypeptidase